MADPTVEGEALVARYGEGKTITMNDVRDWFALVGLALDESKPESVEFAARQIGMGTIACERLRNGYSNDYNDIHDLAPWVRRHYGIQLLHEALLQEYVPSEREIRSAYDSFVAKFHSVTEMTFDHIFLDAHRIKDPAQIQTMREQAQQLHARLMAGESFVDLAKKYSMAKSAQEGGRSGPVPLGRLSKAIEERILALQDGEIGPMYESPYGFHIFRRVRVANSVPPSFAEKKESLTNQLTQQHAKELEDNLRQAVNWEGMPDRLRTTLPWSLETAHLPGLATQEIEVFLRHEFALEHEVHKRGLDMAPRVEKRLSFWEGRECLKAYLGRTQVEPSVTDEEVQAYIQNHPDRLQTPEQYELKLIKINDRIPENPSPAQFHLAQETTQKKIQEAREKLLNGADFAEVARAYSDDSSATQGGDIGIGPVDRFGHAIAEALRDLKDGEISEIVRGSNYCILVKKVATHPPQPMAPDAMKVEAQKAIRASKWRETLQQEQKQLLECISFQMVNPQGNQAPTR